MVDPVFVEECKAHPILAVASTHAGGSRWKGLVDKLENIQEMSAVEFASAVISGDLSAVDVVSACLVRVRDCDSSLHAFVHLDEEGVFLQAENIDRKRARGVPLGPLAGVPIAIKDSICTVDAPTSCGSKLMGQGDLSWQSPYDAHCVDLLRRADAIVFGKTNLDEFSMGSSTQSGAFGGCRNPVVLDRVPGGSSGGSAVAVASRMVPAALGSDTGGSIRQPASFTSIVGIAPTYGRVSRYGLVAFGSGLDRVGPMAADVRGASRVLDVISGWDAKDATSSRCPAGGYELSCGGELDGIRVGVPVEYFEDGLDPEISRCVLSAVDALSSMGCRVESVSMPHTRYGSAAYCVLASAEASSNLARFYGLRCGGKGGGGGYSLAEMRGAGFGEEVKRRILFGGYVQSDSLGRDYLRRAMAARAGIVADFDRVFGNVDVLATPVSFMVPWLIDDESNDPVARQVLDSCTVPASLAGVPAISVPCGMTAAGCPVGLQLIARKWCETVLFCVAGRLEKLRECRRK